MKTKGICPACGGKISLWAGLKAPTPFHFRCPHCKARLRVAMLDLRPFLILAVLIFIGFVIAWITAGEKVGHDRKHLTVKHEQPMKLFI
jgi:hypothetical protein